VWNTTTKKGRATIGRARVAGDEMRV
jgi:hypothetical protein